MYSFEKSQINDRQQPRDYNMNWKSRDTRQYSNIRHSTQDEDEQKQKQKQKQKKNQKKTTTHETETVYNTDSTENPDLNPCARKG